MREGEEVGVSALGFLRILCTLTEAGAVDPVKIACQHRGNGSGTERAYPYEVERKLDIYLRSHHDQEIYRRLRDEYAGHRRKFARALVTVRIPNDDEDR